MPSANDGLQTMGMNGYHPVSTTNSSAQQYFDEGLTLVYAFNRDQAFAAFSHAAKADPKLAAAYWGEALSEGPNINYPSTEKRLTAGRIALAHASKADMHASELERALIAALHQRFIQRVSDQQRALRYNEAMTRVAQRFADNDDVQVLAAESLLDRIGGDNLYDAAGRPNPLTGALTARLHTILQRNPNHIGANHLWIHAIDASGHPLLALRSARYLSSLTFEPAASHLTHMGSHIYMQIGDWASVAADNERAIVLDEELAITLRTDPTTLDYYNHNLDFAIGAELMRRNFNAANALFSRFKGTNSANITEYLVFEKAWPAIRQLPRPHVLFDRIIWRYAHVLADIAERKKTELRRDHMAFLHALQKIDESDSGDIAIIKAVERGSVDFAQHNKDDGETAFAQALKLQRSQPDDEIPAWRFPVMRQLAEARIGG